ncbi:piggyBac transposable element-derived protein 3-like [Gordionus sp. m RMFG-2023]|uniref:piggyBac transposable element-derived protein 3-like n=1 Tax=Gordionus sp. m RMFG-2023 TaxID=3053472 RepID=UPI0031FD4BD4
MDDYLNIPSEDSSLYSSTDTEDDYESDTRYQIDSDDYESDTHYWSSKPEFHDNFISSIMKVKRFIWLMGHIHINDNILEPSRNDENYDKLYKIRPFIDNIRSSCLKYFLPSEYQAIDEGMIRFKGRIGFRQYMPKKPTKRGFKVWMRCDNSGYMNDFNIYTGKNKEAESNLGYNIVTKFCEGLQNHKIFFDNYFTSYTLLSDLKKKGIYATGTLNKNRRYLLIKNMETKLTRGEFDWRSDKNISIIKWRDNRDVFIMSNYIDPRSVDTVKRKNKKGEVFDVKCPMMIKIYDKFMGSVDHFDHLKSLYKISRKWRKWWLPIFFWLIDAAIINSFIIYNILTDNKLSLKEFRRQIIASELAHCKNVDRDDNIENDNNYTSMQRKNNKPYILPEIRLKNSAHQPQTGTSRRCAHCSTKLNPRRTRWSCKMQPTTMSN